LASPKATISFAPPGRSRHARDKSARSTAFT
jgi:hypothetical protein